MYVYNNDAYYLHRELTAAKGLVITKHVIRECGKFGKNCQKYKLCGNGIKCITFWTLKAYCIKKYV